MIPLIAALAIFAGGIAAPLTAEHGTASWYRDPAKSGLYAAAGPALRVGHWRGRVVQVCHERTCVAVRLSDWCACPRRLIDLSPDAFSRLAPLSRGLVEVTIVDGGQPELPPTDTLP